MKLAITGGGLHSAVVRECKMRKGSVSIGVVSQDVKGEPVGKRVSETLCQALGLGMK